MMEDLLKSIKEAGGISLKQLYEEIEQYFAMLPKIYDYPIKVELNKPKDEILNEFDLIDKLYDPLYLPEVLRLAEYIKENNFNFFNSSWNTHGYYHHTHGYQLKVIIKNLSPIAKKIEEARIKKLDSALKEVSMLSTKELSETPKLFIHVNFDQFNLSEFEKYKDLINKAAYHPDFYKLVPIMLRTLFENILWSIFRDGLNKKHTELYYNKYKRRVRDFSELIYLLDFLKDKDFDPYCKNIINNNIVDILYRSREIGNWTVHEILEQIDKNFADEWKEKLNRTLEALTLLYKNVKGKNIHIAEQSNIIKIKQKLNILSLEMHNSVEYPFQKLFSLFSRPGIEPHLAKKISIQVKKIGEERFLEVLKFYLRESTSSHYTGWRRFIENLSDAIPENERFLIFEDEFFLVTVRYKRNANRVRIYHEKKKFDYSKPEKNPEVRLAFLKSFRERCEESGIVFTE